MVRVVEYLGKVVESPEPVEPALSGQCPFADIKCRKLHRDKKKPVCSTRKPNGTIWMTCRERLCSTQGEAMTEYQRNVLRRIASEVFDAELDVDSVIYKREVSLALSGRQRIRADYILRAKNKAHGRGRGPACVIVEVQGGGSTANTGEMTRYIDGWERKQKRTNKELGRMMGGVNSLENDSWKRQQDQIMTKSSIATQSGHRFVLCVGEALYEYILARLTGLRGASTRKLDAMWDFVLLPMKEVPKDGMIDFEVSHEDVIHTTFHKFSSMVITQGNAQADKFAGEFHTLNGDAVLVDN